MAEKQYEGETMKEQTTTTDERRSKALKLLEAMVEPCEHQQKSGEHEWRKCRRCLAHREAETAHGTALLVVLLTELQRGRRPHSQHCADCDAEEFAAVHYGSFHKNHQEA